MPDDCKKVPDSRTFVPEQSQNHAGCGTDSGEFGTKPKEESYMLGTNKKEQEQIDLFVRENITEIMRMIEKKCDELDITNDELMTAADVSRTSFYRIWKFIRPESMTDEEKRSKPNTEHVLRLCCALELTPKQFQYESPSGSSPTYTDDRRAQVSDQMWAIISSQRATIEQLQTDLDQLQADNRRLTEIAFSREDDIRANIARNNKLTDALLERHDQLFELNRQHNERIDKLIDALLKSEK